MFTDQAALNAAAQFNASSQNQVNQFFSQLQSQVGQFNASQANAQSQYNAGQVNTIERFNGELNNQREQFNAQNRLVIDQANAQWRRQIATADTTAINRANELNATALLGLSNTAYNNLWQHYGDIMEWAWTSSENNAERVMQMAMAELDAKVRTDLKNLEAEIGEAEAIGGLVSDLFFKPIGKTLMGGIFGIG
jgi:F0F1-type ATP synthase membrane subunit b/b'